MKMMNNLLYKLFIPQLIRNEFTKDRYLKDLKAGKFKDKFNLGVLDDNGIGLWNVKNFVEEPNAMFIGAMGSGKSKACLFTAATWYAANSEQTVMFLVDTAKSAQDYKPLFNYDHNVFTVLQDPEGVHKVIDMLYDEAQERSKKFAEVGGVPNLNIYEDKTGEVMTRYVVVMEEFHEIPRILDFEKQNKIEGSSAAKFFFLMRTGRSLGIWFLICSQKSTKSDIPSEVVQNFTQKQIFKVSKAEAEYVLSRQEPAMLNSEQKGRCFNDKGEIQFPYMEEQSVAMLLKQFAKPMISKSALLTTQMIKDILSGKSSRDRYQHKKIAALAKNFETMPSQIVITMFHEAMGCTVQELTQSVDPNNISHVITYPNGERCAVMIKITKKIASKHVQQLIQGIQAHGCHKGILYTSAETPSTSLYRFANEHDIELVDKEDLVQAAQILDHDLEKGIKGVYKADSIASKDKEAGSYQKNNNIQDKPLNEMVDEDDEDDGISFVDEVIDQLEIDTVIDKELEKVREMENQTDEDSLDDIIPAKREDPPMEFSDPFLKDDILKNLKKVKQDTCDISFKLNPEDTPSFIIHCLRNESNEVYCVLFYVILNNKIKNKYYIYKKVEGQFDYVARRKFDLKSAEDWNSKPLVLDEETFQKTIDRYLENFIPCENKVYVVCWNKDLEFIKERIIKDSVGFTESPSILDNYFKDLGLQETREEIIKTLKLKVDQKDSLFEEIELDYQLWHHTL